MSVPDTLNRVSNDHRKSLSQMWIVVANTVVAEPHESPMIINDSIFSTELDNMQYIMHGSTLQ